MAQRKLKVAPAAPEPERGEDDLTIEELAQETGMTVRNIRAHQSRGLLPPPDVRARTGFYGSEHVTRLRLIQEMQADGFNLNSISRLLEGSPGAADRILGLKDLAGASFQTEEPEILTAEELAERFGAQVGPKELAKAKKTGVLIDLGGGRFEAPSPSLLDAAEEVIRSGVSLNAALGVAEQIRRNSEAVARSFVQLFLTEVWKPFEEAGHPESRWPEVLEAIERLRPLASQALLAVFQGTMTREVDGALGKELERLARRSR